MQAKAQDTAYVPQPTIAAQEQPAQRTPFRNKVVYFGASVGGNLSAMNFNKGYPRPAAPVENQWKPGFTAGLLIGIRLNEKFALQQDYLWTRMQSKETSSATAYVFDYLSLPVLIQYTVFPRVSLLAGPQFDLLIQAKKRVNGQTVTTTRDTEERSIGATAGVGVRLLNTLSFSARYIHGMNHIGLRESAGLQEFKFQSVQVSVVAIF
ncbi:PorT family protein [Hymenobacter sp. BT188]|uniref:porin family protein n=1 Tax=Hymenobacter sp. BT188 TaxID=2763504 RepID=UPI00165114A4|nr:porin family protein [Hymenobacter sp. BT188]MBC6606931.1 PorT family protein [Hymenobacter sp. BT188]